jgi:hypothetical protein
MTEEQEKIVDALSLNGKGFCKAETVVLATDGKGRTFVVEHDGTHCEFIWRGGDISLADIERTVYA